MLCHYYLDKNDSFSGFFMKTPSVELEELYTHYLAHSLSEQVQPVIRKHECV